MKTHIAVGGLIIKSNCVLLVNQSNSFHSKPYWSLPGGKVEFGEDIENGIDREIKEETGIKVLNKELLFTSQVYHKSKGIRVIGFNFLIQKWEGKIQIKDPDNNIIKSEFVTKEKAIELLKSQPWNSETIIEYIKTNQIKNQLHFSER